MWTWERIIEFYKTVEKQPRFEFDEINAHESLSLIESIRSCGELSGIEPFLSHATLCLYLPNLDQSIAIYSDLRGICRVTLHEKKGITPLWEDRVRSSAVIDLIIRLATGKT